MTELEIHTSPTDEDILSEIDENGRVTVSLLARIIDKNEQHVRDRVRRLVEHRVLVQVAPHLYDRPQSALEYLDEDEIGAE